jgi:hypothetical protein
VSRPRARLRLPVAPATRGLLALGLLLALALSALALPAGPRVAAQGEGYQGVIVPGGATVQVTIAARPDLAGTYRYVTSPGTPVAEADARPAGFGELAIGVYTASGAYVSGGYTDNGGLVSLGIPQDEDWYVVAGDDPGEGSEVMFGGVPTAFSVTAFVAVLSPAPSPSIAPEPTSVAEDTDAADTGAADTGADSDGGSGLGDGPVLLLLVLLIGATVLAALYLLRGRPRPAAATRTAAPRSRAARPAPRSTPPATARPGAERSAATVTERPAPAATPDERATDQPATGQAADPTGRRDDDPA